LHLFEFEDLHWFPRWLRNLLTETLQFGTLATHRYDDAAAIIGDLLEQTGTQHVVDLCSGASGPWLALAPTLCERIPGLHVTLTDRYPNPSVLLRLPDTDRCSIHYEPDSIEALALPTHLGGARTLFTSFHHFSEQNALALLRAAVEERVPIAVFEYTERTLRNLMVTPLITPFVIAAATPFMRPVSPARLFWTYVIPIVPFVTAWDGTISHLRTYAPEELHALTASIEAETYRWRIGQEESGSRKVKVTYLLGWPEAGA